MTKPNREQELEKDINILKDKGIACSKCGLICCWLLEHEAELKGIHEERERIRKMVHAIIVRSSNMWLIKKKS